MALKGKELVEKRNILNEVRKNSMSLQELRFFSIYLSKINARDPSTRNVRFPLTDFQKIMEFGRLNTTQLKATTDSLLGKVVSVPTERGGYTSFQLFKECTVDKDEFEQWYVEIDAHDKALPLMFDFKKEYFTYELWNALRLRSPNQLRMYELLKQYEKVGERKITLQDLRELLGIGPDEYPRWDRFKDRVLESCQQALLENTDLTFDYVPIKSGRKITGVHFYIKKNTQYVDQLSLDEFIDQQGETSATHYIDVEPDGDRYEQIDMFESRELTREEVYLIEGRETLRKLMTDQYDYTDAELDEFVSAIKKSEWWNQSKKARDFHWGEVQDAAFYDYAEAQYRYSRARSTSKTKPGFLKYLMSSIRNNHADLPTLMPLEHSSSFDTDEFFEAAVRRTYKDFGEQE